MTSIIWLNELFLMQVHDLQLMEHGGATGIRDKGLLSSAMARPLNAFHYGERDIHTLASLYAEGNLKNHPFVDGNKRTGFVACLTFLAVNGFELTAPMEERLAMTLSLAASDIDAEAYAAWLRENTEPAAP